MSAFPSSTTLAGFDRLSQMADEGMNPGVVRISGVDFACGLVLGEIQQLPRADGGGTVRVQEAHISFRKSLLMHAPAKDALVTCNGIEFKVRTVDGYNAGDSAWSIVAVRFPK